MGTLRIQVYVTDEKLIEMLKRDKSKIDGEMFMETSWSQYVTSTLSRYLHEKNAKK